MFFSLKFFYAFSDDTRLKIIILLILKPLCVNEIAAILSINQTTISHQLKILKSLNIVDCERNGKSIMYYIKNENNTKSFSEVAADYSTRAETVGRLSNYRFFYDMDDPCGYYCPSGSGGICGYIGLSLIIGYRDKYRDNNYMSNTYWQNSSTKNNLIDGSNSLAAHLRNKHGSSDSTDSNKIKAVSQSYFKGRNLDVTHTSKIWGTFNRNTIMDAIDADNPVLLFGSLEDPSDNGKSILHAVVAYKYTDESGIFGSTVYTAHFGWNNYSNIFVYGTIGSIYILD